ncbi:IQ and ubiquitin-like domain-containing protein [Nibea albiflora]|uniref:IQ and ubiquitin-like domain-containing protein n=1 Tax=Nibea albiflora TaxID=240163 RepID=A0ACB7FDU9_NIBAL|nr:IQ and ubiquitin-like domain-containing protein [Nibea albiflora]
MSEQSEDKEPNVKEMEDETAETYPQTGESTARQPPGDDGEPGSDGEEVHADRTTTDVLETVEEAETQADLPDDVEQLREPQSKEDVGNSTATVKVVLVPEGHVMTVAFAIGLSIQELKCHLASELRVPADVLQISLDEHDNMPDVITVRVQTDEGVFQEVVVEIERPRQQKAFLGGFRHRLTGVEYHHAALQTLPKRRPDRGVVVFSRETQTVKVKSQAQQCPVNVYTQMTGIGCYVSCMNDKLVAPGNYITADEYHDRRLKAVGEHCVCVCVCVCVCDDINAWCLFISNVNLMISNVGMRAMIDMTYRLSPDGGKVICLQSFVRRWLAQQEVNRLRRERDRRMAWLELQERKRREEKEEQLRDRHQRMMNPRRREDINLLYQALEKWRCEEEQRINSTLRGAERKAALCSLLEQETQQIATIGRHQIAIQNDNYDKTVRSFLDKCAAPHRWRGADGRLIEMDSQHTIRARELQDLYNNINLFTVSREARRDALTALKHTVQEHECQLTRDIVDLIDREVDLMTCGVKSANLEGLRKRISTLFLQYIKIPEFNPEVAKLLKVPQNPSQLRNNMFLCRSCYRYLPSGDFSPSANARLSGRCHECTSLDNIARTRNDYTYYKNILKRLRADEQQFNKEAKIPFLLQVEDMRYLVEVVWTSRSALQASKDLFNLVFVRWERQRDWSPWNCILLSKEEISAHLQVEDVHKAYEATFVRGIEHKHTLARRHFSQISVMAEYLDSQPSASLGNQLVSKPITMATGKHGTNTTPDSAH